MYGAHDNETLEQEQVRVAVAGRMMAKRVMGKASFVKLAGSIRADPGTTGA